MTIYLDNQATTACDPRVVDAMLPFLTEAFGNPHSTQHAPGRRAADAVERARDDVARLLGADSREIVFTSGATEANNLAIKGAARFARSMGNPARRVVTVATEHACVLQSVLDLEAEGWEPVVLPVRPDGRLDLASLEAALAVPTLLVSVMAAHNETGVLQDIGAIARLARRAGALFHTDAAQAAGKVPLDVAALGVDLASVSGHKMYGPKGIGALFVRRRPRVRLAPLFSGGGQERGFRSGTLPTMLVVGFGEACRLARETREAEAARAGALRDGLRDRLAAAIPGLAVNGSMTDRLPGNLNLRFPPAPDGRPVDALALMARCPDLAVSTGSACRSAAVEPSTTLRAMGLDAASAGASLRLSIGRSTSARDVERAGDMLIDAWHGLAATAGTADVRVDAAFVHGI